MRRTSRAAIPRSHRRVERSPRLVQLHEGRGQRSDDHGVLASEASLSFSLPASGPAALANGVGPPLKRA